jgi:hypothetical protein
VAARYTGNKRKDCWPHSVQVGRREDFDQNSIRVNSFSVCLTLIRLQAKRFAAALVPEQKKCCTQWVRGLPRGKADVAQPLVEFRSSFSLPSSQTENLAQALMDSIGPRLAGSASFAAASDVDATHYPADR